MPPELITKEWFASSYQFTEAETEGLSLDALEWYPIIKAARVHAGETRHAQNQRVQQLTQESHANGNQIPFTSGMKTPGSG